MTLDPNRTLPPQRRDELLSRPAIKQRLLVMDIITGAFFAATLIYLWIARAGLLQGTESSGEGFPMWYVLVFLPLTMIPVMFVMGVLFLRQMRSMESWSAVLERGQTLLIIELAFGEAVAVYGLIGPFLGAPKSVQYGLIGFGMVLMAAAVGVLRSRIINLALARFTEDTKDR